ncbi:GNAT family protein [Streptomyces sp. NPDC001185]|uniref:GNAT family N-acetyltransferase n=1 Tax=Streptomyces sp. NPDC001185 TaxID=3154380 RepID=UPI00332CEB26
MTDLARTTAGLPKVILEIERDNHPSISVARSSGFRQLKSPPETVTDKGRTYDLLTWEHNSTAAGRE